MKAKELKIGIVLGLILLLVLSDFSAATTIEDDWWNESSILCDNSNSIVIEDIEYYFLTDKSVYNLVENVNMTYRVTNLRDQNVTFRFSTTLQRNFWIDKNEINVWRAYDGGFTIPTEFTLAPGDNKTFTCIWDMKNKQGELVDVGNYIATGGLHSFTGSYDFTRVSVDIVVVPEPATILLLAMGTLLVRGRSM